MCNLLAGCDRVAPLPHCVEVIGLHNATADKHQDEGWRDAEEAVSRALLLSPRDPLSALYYGAAAYAQLAGRNYEKAIKLAREAIHLRGDFVGGHRVLTAAAGMAGHGELAAAALQELRRVQPRISLAWIAAICI